MSGEADSVQPPARIIPKFGSFKPATSISTPVPATTQVEEEDAKKDRKKSSRRHRSRSRDGDRDRDRRHRHHKSDNRSRERERRHRDRDRDRGRREKDPKKHRYGRSRSPTDKTTAVGRRSPSPEEWDAPKNPFFIDTKGDPGNEQFGTLHQYAVPTYHRGGKGRIVGLSSKITIDRDNWDGKNMVLKGMGSREPAPRNRSGFARLESQGIKMLMAKKDETGLEEAFARGLDFVPLSAATKKRKNSGGGASTDDDEDYEANHYRSLEGLKKKGDEPEDKDLVYASDSQSDGDYVANQEWGDRKRMVEFVRKVDAEPMNIDAWIAYVDHHDTIIHGSGRRKTAAEKTSTAEIKLDILSKALDKNPLNEQLLIKYMEVAAEIWDSKKLLEKWLNILDDGPALFGLWTRYLSFRQTDFLSFTYPECKKCFSWCITLLRTALFKTKPHNSEREKLEEIIVYVFLRATLMMYESGYRENAIGAFQAMLEVNLFRSPNAPSPDTLTQREHLYREISPFWDSEAPRIGDPNAVGWKNTKEDAPPPDPRHEEVAQHPIRLEDPFGSWVNAELEWSDRSSMPARTTDEVEEDDPYQVILFHDVQEFLVCFTCPATREKLIEAFLVFFNLPSLHLQSSNTEEAKDVFLRNGHFDRDQTLPLEHWFWPKKGSKWDPVMITWEGMEPEKKDMLGDNPFEFQLLNTLIGEESMFSKSDKWFDGLQGMRMSDESLEEREFVKNALQLMVFELKHKNLALYYLAWTWVNYPGEAKKTAKALLKVFKTSLLLWSAYAQIVWYSDSPDEGRKIFPLALGMSQSFSDMTAKRDAIHLWHTWIWAEIHAANPAEALRLLLSIETGKPQPFQPQPEMPVPKPQLLRSKRHLESSEQASLSLTHFAAAAAYNDLRALLAHFSNTEPTADTLESTYNAFLTHLSTRSHTPHHIVELTHLRRSRLLYLISTTTKPFKPATLRSTLESSLSVFPSSPHLLSLYAWNESRTKIENRVRNVLLRHDPATPTAWLFAVWVELRLSANVHAVRSLFERAVQKLPGCVTLWGLYVSFELRQQTRDRRKRAKEVWVRGLRVCPWSKGLVMLGLCKLRDSDGEDYGGLGFEETRKIHSVAFSEKELRCSDVTELEDMIEEVVEKREREERERNRGLEEEAESDEEMLDEW